MHRVKNINLLLFSILFWSFLFSQSVSITIDDVPNTRTFKANNYHSTLLEKLDSLNIPVAIFINEGKIKTYDSEAENLVLVEDWIKREYITLGNHTFKHSRYSATGFDNFKQDVLKGNNIILELAEKHNKKYNHFRFPYNDLGKDSLQHIKIRSFLDSLSFKITPYTIESSDWMFNSVYEYYLKNNMSEKAAEIGNLHVDKTIEYFKFHENLVKKIYNRKIKHIYLCHDNPLNADYLEVIVSRLRERGYNFISLDDALTDSVYNQGSKYFRKWGISWLYRWMPNQKERIKWMKQEPDMSRIEDLFEKTSNESEQY